MNLVNKVKEYREKWKGKFVPFFIGAATLQIVIAGFFAFDAATTSITFCTSCHSMELMGKEYKESVHYMSDSGVRAICADCHVPENIIPALWEHLKASQMVLGEFLHDFKDPAETEKRRPHMAFKARKWFADHNSATCKKCHVQEAIMGRRPGIASVHTNKTLMEEDANCVGCHINLVHRHVPGEKVFNKEAWDRMIDVEYGKISKEEADKIRQKQLAERQAAIVEGQMSKELASQPEPVEEKEEEVPADQQ